MIFTKMQLNGNDFIFINSLESKIKIYKNFICEICDRNFGVGADGVVLISLSEKADCKIEIYNSDGLKAKICGNALLLLGKYLFELEDFELERLKLKEKLKNNKINNISKIDDINNLLKIKIETDSGIKELGLEIEYGEIKSVKVNIEKIELITQESATQESATQELITQELATRDFGENLISINFLSVGNQHIVIVVNDVDKVNIKDIIENSSEFLKLSQEYNIEFMQKINEEKIKIKIFERGVGETYSCGSGACACAFVAVKNKFCNKNKEIAVISKGGMHKVKFLENSDIVISGKPQFVYTGYLKK